jgi:hypothetical protein
MVHIKDEGSQFDAPLDIVWKYVQNPEDHGRTHNSRNTQVKPLGENTMELSWEQDLMGTPVKIKSRVTALPPVGLAIEMLEGPMAGSKFFNIYTPRGNKTEVSVIGDFGSKTIPPVQVEPTVRGFLEVVYNEDAAAIRELARRR